MPRKNMKTRMWLKSEHSEIKKPKSHLLWIFSNFLQFTPIYLKFIWIYSITALLGRYNWFYYFKQNKTIKNYPAIYFQSQNLFSPNWSINVLLGLLFNFTFIIQYAIRLNIVSLLLYLRHEFVPPIDVFPRFTTQRFPIICLFYYSTIFKTHKHSSF